MLSRTGVSFFLFVTVVITLVAALVIFISTIVFLAVHKNNKDKYYYADICALVILAICAGLFYRFFYLPRSEIKKIYKEQEDARLDYMSAVIDYRNALSQLEAQNLIEGDRGEEVENNLDNLNKELLQNSELQELNKHDGTRPSTDLQFQPEILKVEHFITKDNK